MNVKRQELYSREVNFDGLIGPTHNYAGLSLGNIASMGNEKQISNPREAALQGLDKMKSLMDRGFAQGVLAPHLRPDIRVLRRLGFSGVKDADVLLDVFSKAPKILSGLSSASSMWTANAATVSPSADTANSRVHFTPANLVNKFHRFIEPEATGKILKATFSDKELFEHHEALPSHDNFGDEGAANHTRFCIDYGDPGVEFFVYGRNAEISSGPHPKKFPARQTREASEAVCRLHQLDSARVVYAQQNPSVIDQGVFHNDVIAVGNKNCLFFHEQAFLNTGDVTAEISKKFGNKTFNFIEVKTQDVPVLDAVKSYLFNSQLLSLPKNRMALLVPEECRQTESVWSLLEKLKADSSNPIAEVIVKDVKQSMKNGGGPACLRLRVVLTDKELAAVNQKTLLTTAIHSTLCAWVNKHYRDRLSEDDLHDPSLLMESQVALDELTQILELGSVYSFQT